jgi:hypothetical protein
MDYDYTHVPSTTWYLDTCTLQNVTLTTNVMKYLRNVINMWNNIKKEKSHQSLVQRCNVVWIYQVDIQTYICTYFKSSMNVFNGSVPK